MVEAILLFSPDGDRKFIRKYYIDIRLSDKKFIFARSLVEIKQVL